MSLSIATVPNAPVRDACAERIFGLSDPVTDELMERPLTRRLIVQRAGCYRDSHHHLVEWPEGSEFTVLYVCTAGSGRLRVRGREYSIVPGTAFLIPRDVPHAYVGRRQPWTLWWCSLLGTEVAAVVEELGMTPEHPVAAVGNPERLVAMIEEVARAYRNVPSAHDGIEMSGIGWQLISRLDASRAVAPNSEPLASAIRYLEECFRTDIRIPELSAIVGVSPAKLTALFHEATGGGVLSYLIDVRMSEGRRLLVETSSSISEVARAVGYRDPYYFSREFGRRQGMSPSEYRRQHLRIGDLEA